MIVDDEALARYALKMLISKNFSNLEIVGEAENGNEAIEMSKATIPHIILMDVKMPGINGIDAAQEILKNQPDTKILILTAYDNFNYVQDALNIGARGYLLKPIKKDEIVRKINEVIKDIKESKEKTVQSEHVDNKIKVVKPFIEKELVSAFATGCVDIEEIRSYLNFLQEDIKAGYFMLINFGTNYSLHINDAIRNRIHKEKVYEVTSKFLNLLKKCLIGNSIGNLIVIFFPTDSVQPDHLVTSEAIVIAKEIKRKIKVIAKLEVSIGIGNRYFEIEDFRRSFNEANYAMNSAVEKIEVIHYSQIELNLSPETIQYPVKLEEELLEQLRVGNIAESRELVKSIVEKVLNQNAELIIIKDYLSQLVIMVKRTVAHIKGGNRKFENSGALVELNNLYELDEIKLWSINTINSVIDRVEEFKAKKERSALNRIHEFINLNFHKDLTLEMVAAEVGLSRQYVSKTFKEEYGMNFIDYVTLKRLEVAKELLKSGYRNIKEISLKAGYIDPNYFCRIFKKITGVTPKEFRVSNSGIIK